MLAYILKGIVLGISAGFSPGPLSALVIKETLQHNTRAGMLVGLAPLVTDAPIVLLSYFVLAHLTGISWLLGGIAFVGALFLGYLGYESITIKPLVVETGKTRANSLLRGVLANFLSPNPYLFWLTVGSPLMITALQSNAWNLPAFLAGFYMCLISCKLLMAYLTGKSKAFITGRAFLVINRIMGILLFILAALFVRDGVRFFIQK
ncbi:MAG TPA: LysE family transporter [bacterium]|nr:LysE family transporter [bacterium]HPN45795.1 LysE family transporter [bacterium]